MTYTKSRHLLAAALVAAMLAYLWVSVDYGSLPRLPLLAGVALLVVAIVDAVLALTLRPRVRRDRGVEPIEPLTATRVVALAKASSMAGSIMAGAWLGLLAYLLPILSRVDAARSDAAACVVGLISALAAVAAGLWLEYCLRNPDEPEEDDADDDRRDR